MKLSEKIRNLKFRSRIYVYFTTIFIIVFVLILVLYQIQIKRIFEKTHHNMEVDLGDVISMLTITEELTGEGFTDKDYNILKPVFRKKKFFETGYPFLITKSGDYLIHPTKEGENSVNSLYHQKRLSFKRDKGYFKYIYTEDPSKPTKWQYFEYFKPYDAYIAVSFFEDELFRELAKFRNLIIISGIIVIIMFFYGTFLMLKPIMEAINHIVFNISEMTKGKLVNKLTIRNNDEIGEIAKSINVLIEANTGTVSFANEIGNGNLDVDYKRLSNEDALGESLLKMRDNLKQAKIEEDKRNTEVERQNWASKGLARFTDILHQNNNNIEELGTEIITNLVNYLKANQGGIFILNDDNKENVHFSLLSAYAFDRRKFMEKHIEPGEGLVGTCAIEKKTIFMTDLPQDYIQIKSGLGGSNPNSLLIVPLKIEENVLGVIELASFNIFQDFEIEFVEKLAESIASTLSSVRINVRTSQLLERSQQQAEEMAAQEEEMRQNMEELQATQEESSRKVQDFEIQLSEAQDVKAELESKLKKAHEYIEKLENKLKK